MKMSNFICLFSPLGFLWLKYYMSICYLQQVYTSLELMQTKFYSREKVTIPQLTSFITIEGAGADKTIVQWGDTAQTPGPRGQPLGTYGSATFAVNAPYFIAKNITFKVTYSLPFFFLCMSLYFPVTLTFTMRLLSWMRSLVHVNATSFWWSPLINNYGSTYLHWLN